jgi:hypothetical protein
MNEQKVFHAVDISYLVNTVSIGPILGLLYRWLKLNFIIFTKNGPLLKLLAYSIKYSCQNIWGILLRLLEPDFNLHAIRKEKNRCMILFCCLWLCIFLISEPLTDFHENLCGWWKLPPPPQYRVTVWQIYELVWWKYISDTWRGTVNWYMVIE